MISLLILWLAAPVYAGGQYSTEGAEEHVKVVAHIELPEMHVNGMFVQHRDKKDFLYLHRPTKQAFAVVDVTKPEKPALVERATLSEPPHAHVEVNPTEPLLAISVTPEDNPAGRTASATSGGAPSSLVLPTETVKLLNLTDPKHPKTLKTFTGVTSYLPDDSRRLIYIVNQEGLWVVSHRQTRPMPFCTSADALTQEPNCQ
jgi:hypothetical protein